MARTIRRGARASGRLPWPVRLVVLIGGIASAVALLVGSSSGTDLASAARAQCGRHPPQFINDGFPEPKLVYSHGGRLDYTLTEAPSTIDVGSTSYTAMAYNGQIPGPALVICPGDHLTLHVVNDLTLPTNIHLHGLHVSPSGDSDDVFVEIKPGQSRTYNYQIPYDQTAGTFWYHPHFHPDVQAEVESGLAGALLVAGSLDDEFANIPQRLMVIDGGREIVNPSAAAQPPYGQPVDGPPVLLVNGVHDPTVNIAPGQLQRWRLVNATSDRELRLEIPGVTFQELAADGITLHKMLPQSSLLLAPGSRADVLVRGPAAGPHAFISEPFQKCFADCLDPYAGEGQSGAPNPQETLLTVNSAGATQHAKLPTGPLDYPKYLGDLRHAHVNVYRKLYFARVQRLITDSFPLNGKLYDPNRVDVTMKLGSIEQWTLVNPATATSDEWHTFHIHTNPFQVISINGHKLNYVLWEDNVDIPPGATIVIRIHPTDFTGKSVFHCHLLFHEDNGMMGVFQIVKDPPRSEVDQDRVMYMIPPSSRQVNALLAEARASGQHVTRIELLCHPLSLA